MLGYALFIAFLLFLANAHLISFFSFLASAFLVVLVPFPACMYFIASFLSCLSAFYCIHYSLLECFLLHFVCPAYKLTIALFWMPFSRIDRPTCCCLDCHFRYLSVSFFVFAVFGHVVVLPSVVVIVTVVVVMVVVVVLSIVLFYLLVRHCFEFSNFVIFVIADIIVAIFIVFIVVAVVYHVFCTFCCYISCCCSRC